MPADLTWLIGKRLLEVAKMDFTWSFVFSDGGSIATESDWRLLASRGIEATSSDDGQLFGLKAPLDASERVLTATQGKKILEIRLAPRTSDLSLVFEEDVRVDFLNLSCGYESWRAGHGTEEVICMGGGQLSIHSNEKKG
jgi:hypothetical protein